LFFVALATHALVFYVCFAYNQYSKIVLFF